MPIKNPASKMIPDLGRSLLQVGGHLHAALVQQPQLSEEQGELPQVLLELSEAILVHRLALCHPIRELKKEQEENISAEWDIVCPFLDLSYWWIPVWLA